LTGIADEDDDLDQLCGAAAVKLHYDRLPIPAATCACRRSFRGGRMAQSAEDHPLDRRTGLSLWREPKSHRQGARDTGFPMTRSEDRFIAIFTILN
jgi:hypothetical protein